jgi:hypothetical protein
MAPPRVLVAPLLLQLLLLTLQGTHAVDMTELKASAQAFQPWLKQIRRELHQFPGEWTLLAWHVHTAGKAL